MKVYVLVKLLITSSLVSACFSFDSSKLTWSSLVSTSTGCYGFGLLGLLERSLVVSVSGSGVLSPPSLGPSAA